MGQNKENSAVIITAAMFFLLLAVTSWLILSQSQDAPAHDTDTTVLPPVNSNNYTY